MKKIRRNPSIWTTLASAPFRRSHPEIFQELRETGNESLEDVSRRLEEWTGERVVADAVVQRYRSLFQDTIRRLEKSTDSLPIDLRDTREVNILAIYIRERFALSSIAVAWLTNRDQRLGVWCTCQFLRYVSSVIEDRGYDVSQVPGLISMAERWVSEPSSVTAEMVYEAAQNIDYDYRDSDPTRNMLDAASYLCIGASGRRDGAISLRSSYMRDAIERAIYSLAVSDRRSRSTQYFLDEVSALSKEMLVFVARSVLAYSMLMV